MRLQRLSRFSTKPLFRTCGDPVRVAGLRAHAGQAHLAVARQVVLSGKFGPAHAAVEALAGVVLLLVARPQRPVRKELVAHAARVERFSLLDVRVVDRGGTRLWRARLCFSTPVLLFLFLLLQLIFLFFLVARCVSRQRR